MFAGLTRNYRRWKTNSRLLNEIEGLSARDLRDMGTTRSELRQQVRLSR